MLDWSELDLNWIELDVDKRLCGVGLKLAVYLIESVGLHWVGINWDYRLG